MIIQPARGGQARISEDDYIEGAPELVAEVASSSASYDLGKKLNVYRRSGVREYVVWRVLDREVDWFVNREGRFERIAPCQPTAFCAARYFPAFGSIQPPSYETRRRRSRRSSSRDCTPPSTPTSSPGWSELHADRPESRRARYLGARRTSRMWSASVPIP